MRRGTLLLGLDDIEQLIEQLAKGLADGYPPYNIACLRGAHADGSDLLRITLAVAGFSADDLEVVVEGRRLSIRGRQSAQDSREYLHRGIAARQFQRSFTLAGGLEVDGADLSNGLLTIDLKHPRTAQAAHTIEIGKGR